MDPATIATALSAIPGVAPYVPYVAGAVALCGLLTVIVPPPTDASPAWWKATYAVVNKIALNFGHARNVPPAVSPDQGTKP